MTLSITLGWWLVPLAITLASAAFVWARAARPSKHWLDEIGLLFYLPTAAAVCLGAWLIWSLFA